MLFFTCWAVFQDPVQVYFVKDGLYTVALGALIQNAEYHRERNVKEKQTS